MNRGPSEDLKTLSLTGTHELMLEFSDPVFSFSVCNAFLSFSRRIQFGEEPQDVQDSLEAGVLSISLQQKILRWVLTPQAQLTLVFPVDSADVNGAIFDEYCQKLRDAFGGRIIIRKPLFVVRGQALFGENLLAVEVAGNHRRMLKAMAGPSHPGGREANWEIK